MGFGAPVGDVVGPSSSVDNAIVRFAGTTGRLVQGYTSGDPVITDDGVSTLPAQPAVLAHNSANDFNVTGDGTQFTVIFDTEVYDQNGDFDGTSTFTAPVTGRYLVATNVFVFGLLVAASEVALRYAASNRIGTFHRAQEVATDTNTYDEMSLSGSVIVDMDAGDTVTINMTVAGMAQVADVHGAPATHTQISVMKIA